MVYGWDASTEPIDAAADLTERVRERGHLDRELIAYARRLYAAKLAALDMVEAGDPEILPPTIARLAEATRSP